MRVGLDWRPSHRARHRLLAALAPGSALSVALATVGALLAPGAAHAQSAGQPTLNQITHESGSPIEDQGSNYDYRSNITSVTPNVPGLSLEVLEFADRLVLTNHTGKTVTVYGYEGEPYARVQADGTVEVNTHSPAYYLNQSFYGQVTVPAFASSEATPHWVVADRTDSFEWHDHRIHWMSPIPPARVNGTGRRTLIFDWQVPIRVGAQMGHIDGQLFWAPESSKAPTAVIALGVAIALLGLALVLFVRRRRARLSARPATGAGAGDGDRGAGEPQEPAREAW